MRNEDRSDRKFGHFGNAAKAIFLRRNLQLALIVSPKTKPSSPSRLQRRGLYLKITVPCSFSPPPLNIPSPFPCAPGYIRLRFRKSSLHRGKADRHPSPPHRRSLRDHLRRQNRLRYCLRMLALFTSYLGDGLYLRIRLAVLIRSHMRP